MKIQLLSQNLVNQIAAGEVIERPSSIIKELMENAIDAGANEIIVEVVDAGKSFISLSDDGAGMDKESLELCVLSHATSKLSSENLFDIHTFGFRGEALPSIASVSRLSITSADNSFSEAWTISLEGTSKPQLSLANRKKGTTVEVRDLFFATPARLKFLKSNSIELDFCYDSFRRTALAFPDKTFKFFEDNREKLFYCKTDDLQQRVRDVLGDSFAENTFEIKAEKDKLKLHGFIGVPTFNKASMSNQYFFVNKRFVKDKNFSYALRSAYAGLAPAGRYATAVLFLDIPYNEVDVNAHPAKVEIRFKESEKIRFFVLSELKKALSSFGAMKPTTEMIASSFPSHTYFIPAKRSIPREETAPTASHIFFRSEQEIFTNINLEEGYTLIPEEQSLSLNMKRKISLGNAIHQLGNTYIIAENDDNLIIVDQHAAAERITLEKLRNDLTLETQTLLLPEICPLKKSQIEQLETNNDIMLKFGIHYEKLAPDLISINALPAILGTCDAKALVKDIVEELSTFGDAYAINEKIYRILSTISCHGSLRAGKKLTIQEMNSLLRQMEDTANIAQCCHGRPSYVILSSKKINKFFERS
ncbi:MAG: DNA mismatch repair endonuclease MutL [Holosporaceae bacterium]|jgi:DNA mismatch repair protein MutL|nr:DNA mismatch repair endonuclease MutL [Holosporaceae bacterium]